TRSGVFAFLPAWLNIPRLAVMAGIGLVIVGGWWLYRRQLDSRLARLESESATLRQQNNDSERYTNEARQLNQQLSEQLQAEQERQSESKKEIEELQREIAKLKQSQTVSGTMTAAVVSF